MFYKELATMLHQINSKDYNIVRGLSGDLILWHFFHNLNDGERLSKIDTIIQDVFSDKEKWNLQIELIGYFERIAQSHTDQILEYLVSHLEGCQPGVYRRVASLIEKMNPSKDGLAMIYQLAYILLESNDYIVKEFGIRNAGDKLIGNYPTTELITLGDHIMNKVTKEQEPDNKDQTTINKGAGLSFSFRTRDLYDANFREAIGFMAKISKIEDGSQGGLDYLITRYNQLLTLEVKEKYKDTGLMQYLSTWWLPTTFSKDEYHENDPLHMFAFTIGSILQYWKKNNKEVFNNLSRQLLQTSYVVYFEILVRVLDTDILEDLHDILKEKIICNTDLWNACEIGDQRRYDLFKNYRSKFPEDIEEFSTVLKSYDDKNSKQGKPDRATGILAASVSEDKRNEDLKIIIKKWRDYLSANGIEERDPVPYEDSNIRELDRTILTAGELLNKSVTEITGTLIDYCSGDNFEKSVWDLYDPFKEYFTTYPDRREEFYAGLKDPNAIEGLKQFDGYLETIGRATEGLLETVDKSNREGLLDYLVKVDVKLHDRDRGSRRKIISILNSEPGLRSNDFIHIKNDHPTLYTSLIEMITRYKNFNEADPTEVNDTHALIDYSNNAVVGGAIELLTVMLYFDPQNEEIKNIIRDIVTRGNPVKQAVVVRNLVYIVPDSKDYGFCKEVTEIIGDPIEPCIQYGFIEYMFKLGETKINEYFGTIEYILENGEKDILILLADLLVQLLVNGITGPSDKPIEFIIDKVISDQKKYISGLERFSRSLGNNMDFVFVQDAAIQEKVLKYYKAICEIQENQKDKDDKTIYHIKVSLSYFLDRLPTSRFDTVKDAGIFEMLFKSNAGEAYQNVNEYLLKCLKEGKYIEESIDILMKEKELMGQQMAIFLTQYPYDDEIANIIGTIKEIQKTGTHTISEPHINFIDNLFDEGLKLGGDKFYKLFEQHYKQDNPAT